MTSDHDSIDGIVDLLTRRDILSHERVLIKSTVAISSDEEFLSGPLNQFPIKKITIPEYTIEKAQDTPGCCYIMSKRDPQGEKKIKQNGELLCGRKFLFNTFKLKTRNNNVLVLVNDLISSLQLDYNEEKFLEEYNQLLPLEASLSEREFLKDKNLIPIDYPTEKPIKFIVARVAFVQFGASIIVAGTRIIDDYWETVAKDEGFTSHHRVFKFTDKLFKLYLSLQPGFNITNSSNKNHDENLELINENSNINYNLEELENPSLTVIEQTSADVRKEYLARFSKGEPMTFSVPGQNINGSLDISNQYKIPKYHNRYSFQQATQMNAMDLPIFESPESIRNNADNESDLNSPTVMPSSKSNSPSIPMLEIQHPSTTKPVRRMVSCLLDSGNDTKFDKKSSKSDLLDISQETKITDDSLTINGWKFGILPILSKDMETTNSTKYAASGLPYFDKEKLIPRLKKLTPNQIKELEHMHDAVSVSGGLQTARSVRQNKWFKYWQYKSGVPVGLKKYQYKYFKDVYLKEILSKETSYTEYDEVTNTDRTYITAKIPGANFLDNSNIKNFSPPYGVPPKKLQS
ncbi:hypothetical protein Kpol_1023p2 [Vanderwaltozyma polyspora DSM 70294]|uniref:Uncharacterized protein n=1 Tax=Vanderwaltozyma polyspora (strain ATCC 22028 / DSM 70294 / BCRC 21397 / CBS 2163 / NBRC 10782 / NRRL Y-8283 / UCD 57-17) TaxID=436907 RepID=A7TFM5_VANPO|nr:uncharacterized protein Kpol_1023p2 [Vanderwaltozyma polyspora DSM 70294]EDO18833.1 hypothetical protein Kpol_1023p2 [Vanderwaltozyma polyspora DSM 70294]